MSAVMSQVRNAADAMRPLPPMVAAAPAWNDRAKKGYSLGQLMQLVSDCAEQPDWRRRADVAAAYVDGKQLSAEQKQAAYAEGLGEVRETNLIGRVIRSVCGSEAKARTDIKVESDDEDSGDVSEVLNARIKEAQRESYADMAVSDAYFGQVGPGVGWVEVARSTDPMQYPYRVASVHRSEVWWDWKDNDLLLRYARWLIRKKWGDLDELEAGFPEHREVLRMLSNGAAGLVLDGLIEAEDIAYDTNSDLRRQWSSISRRTEWFDAARKRVKLFEVWYRVPAMVTFMRASPTRNLIVDLDNPVHVKAINSGVQVFQALSSQVRMALFAGPFRLFDRGTTRRSFPYVPFFAYRDDADMSPYGLVEGMIGPQDGYNRRRLRIEWMLRARQITMDSDALDTNVNSLAEIAKRIMRPDLTVVLNPNRKNVNGFNVGTDLQLQKEQLEAMANDKQLIQDVPGVYGSQLGQAASGVTSGIANSLLIEQGAVAMGDMNDNYRHARRAVFENLLDLVCDDLAGEDLQVPIGRGASRRTVVLNHWQSPQEQAQTLQQQGVPAQQLQARVNPNGQVLNNVDLAPVRVGLGEVPSTPAYRIQQQQQIAQIVQALAQASPQAAAVMAPSFIEATDLPDRLELADNVRRLLGLPTQTDKDAQAAQQQQQQEEMEGERQTKQQLQQLAVAKATADVEKVQSDTELNKAKVIQLGHGATVDSIRAATDAHKAGAKDADQSIVERQNALIEAALAEAAQGGLAPPAQQAPQPAQAPM